MLLLDLPPLSCSRPPIERTSLAPSRIVIPLSLQRDTRIFSSRLPKNLRCRRREKLPPQLGIDYFKKTNTVCDPNTVHNEILDSVEGEEDIVWDPEEIETNTVCDPNTVHNEILDSVEGEEDIVWDPEEIDAISSLFRGRIPQKPGKLNRERPLPLPLPYKLRPLGLPTAKQRVKVTSQGGSSSRSSITNRVYKNPEFLFLLAKEIRSLSSEEDVSAVLDNWVQFLRKGSLSLTIRELGRMGLPERALQTFCWAQKQPGLFPDDRSLASTIEILARSHELKIPFDLDKLTSLASRGIIEAMIRGFIRGGSLNLAWKLVSIAKNKKRVLDPSIYAKLILELGKNPDKHALVLTLLEEIGEREDLKLNQQDCTALMKICIRLKKFEIVEGLFNWFRESGREPSVVMYTTMIHSRYSEGQPRKALPLVWEMEALDCVLDLPAYRVAIKLLAALNDLPRTARYFSKLKEAGFPPTYDIYRDLIKMYAESGRVAKCKEINRELEMAGFKLEKKMRLLLETGV